MLQQKQISKILQQGLKPIQTSSSTTPVSSSSIGGIKSISLLSNQGIPLITVSKNSTLGEDYKIYSILGYNSFKKKNQETENYDDNWTIIEFEKNLKCLICKILDLYLILYYNDDEISDEYVKIKLDSLILVLYDGLKGYSDD